MAKRKTAVALLLIALELRQSYAKPLVYDWTK